MNTARRLACCAALIAGPAAAQPYMTISGELNFRNGWDRYPFADSIVTEFTDATGTRGIMQFKMQFNLQVTPDPEPVGSVPATSNSSSFATYSTNPVRLFLGRTEYEVPFDASGLEVRSFANSDSNSSLFLSRPGFDDDGMFIQAGNQAFPDGDLAPLQELRNSIIVNSSIRLASFGQNPSGDIVCYITRVFTISADETGAELLAPIIAVHPNRRRPTVVQYEGFTTTLTSELITGGPPATVLWYRETLPEGTVSALADGPSYSGVDTPILTITVGPETDGLYRAVWQNDNGITESALVEVISRPLSSTPPIVTDITGDGLTDFFDVLAFLDAIETATP